MAVSQMQRVQIFVHCSHRASLVRDLQNLEIIHINNLNEQEESTSEVPADNAHRQDACATEIRDIVRGMQNDLSRIQSTIDYLADFEPKKGFLAGFLGGRIVLSTREYADIAKEVTHGEWRNICNECHSLEEQAAKLNSHESRLRSDKEHLSGWSNLDTRIEEIRDTEKTAIRIGVIPPGTYNELLSEIDGSAHRQDACATDVAFAIVGQTKTDLLLVVMFLKEDEQKTTSILTRYGFSPASLPITSGTVAEQLKRIDEELLEISAQRDAVSFKSAQLAAHRSRLMAIYDHLIELMMQEEVRESFINTDHTFMVDGWVRKEDVENLKRMLIEKYDELEVSVSEPSEGDEPPIYLENNPIFNPFRMVTGLYGLPTYKGTDPTPLFAPFFAISLGICITDAGYGLLVALIAYFISKRMQGSGKDLFRILATAGCTAILIGLLTGGYFGISSDKLPSALAKIQLFDPMSSTGQLIFIGIVLAIGYIQVWFGFFVKMRLCLKSRDWIGAFGDPFPWMLVMIFMPIAVALWGIPEAKTVTVAVILLCLFTITIFTGRANKNPIVRILAGLFDLYGKCSGTFGDILSYMRLFALGLSSGIFSGVVNTMAGLMWGNPIGKLAAIGILIGGHAFNLVMSCLGGFIHTTRLQFVEFFTKFYESGGKEFRPLRRKYVYITVVDVKTSDE